MDEHMTTDAQTPDELATLRKERDEYLAGWKRAQADYANLQKETERARQDFARYAKEDVLSRLLPALDQFEVALQFQPPLDVVPEANRRAFENWVTGLHAVKSLWEAAAKELGLESVTCEGSLDPACHEAVAEESHATIESGKIIRVMQNGWKLNDKLIRPAKVIVSKGPDA
jgi:molecular chaperone GrpE